jgi:hypothetical protein
MYSGFIILDQKIHVSLELREIKIKVILNLIFILCSGLTRCATTRARGWVRPGRGCRRLLLQRTSHPSFFNQGEYGTFIKQTGLFSI